MTNERSEKIAKLNDQLRSKIGYPFNSLIDTNDQFVLTQGIIDSFNDGEIKTIFHDIKTFDNFNEGNDPYQERDFGSLTAKGRNIFWKIDYYDNDIKYHSSDNTDPKQTKRVLTIMLSSEY